MLSQHGAMPRPIAGLWICLLVVIFKHTRIALAATHLRTGVVDAEEWDPEWLNSGHHRQLLGVSDCNDRRWGVLCGRVQVLLQLANGCSQDDKNQLFTSLHAAGAAISGYLPHDTWLVVARPDDLHSSAYTKHTLLPYAPEYKIAPEWHPVLDLVHREQQRVLLEHSDVAAQHMQLHKHVLQHELLQQLQLNPAAAHLHTESKQSEGGAMAAELAGGAPAKLLIGVHFPDLPMAELQLIQAEGVTFNPAAAAVADWEEPLSELVAMDGRCEHHRTLCRPELLASSRWELSVAVCPQDLSEVLYWLSKQASVHWLAPHPRLFLQNSVASMIVQDNGVSATGDYQSPDAHLFWEAGLNGTNQIIGIGDSGIDMDSCFFKDPAVPFVAPAEGTDAWAAPSHRKVVYYWGLADTKYKDLVGHGTHTTGSLAGLNPDDPTNKATGAAKGAKVAFVDLSRTANGDVNAPQDLAAEYYPRLYEQGARIFSDSWGSANAEYDFQSSKADAWLHEHQDCISHFAAGNYGENDNLDTTITSPATAKNVVTVGATKSLTPNYLSQTVAPVFLMSVEVQRLHKAKQYITARLVKADFGGDGSALTGKPLKVVQANPPEACGALTGTYQNAIVLVKRGGCFFSEKMAAGTAAGAAAVVVINNRPGGYFKMDAQDGQAVDPSQISLFAITQRMGEEIWSLYANAESIAATVERYTDTWEAYEDIAAFSSFGPAKDGRIKPDIVCPGELLSASSADNDGDTADTCLVGRKSGTSMATPMVAGHAAIIRQYFLDGFYPTGAATAANSHVPSGPLMKAVMMGGACDMKGNTEAYLPLEDSPSMRQGFGRLCLCSSLKIAGKCNTHLQVVDRVPIADKESHKYCLKTMGGDVRIMLVWYDPPAAVSVGDPDAPTLVNDLDLSVTSAGMGGQTVLGNHGQIKDSVNTAERVWLRNVPTGGLEITVTAAINVPGGTPQNYSLVVQGAFRGHLISPYNPDKASVGQPGGCTAQDMQSVPQASAAAPAEPAILAVNDTANETAASASVVEESAHSARTYIAPVEIPEAAVEGASAARIAPVPTAEAAAEPSPSPSPSPVPDESSFVAQQLETLVTTMTATSPVPEAAPAGRRRLAAVISTATKHHITVKMPAVMCKLLDAAGLAQQHMHAQGDERTLLIPTTAAVAAGAAVLALSVALIAVQSYRRYKPERTTSLTSAVRADLRKNSNISAFHDAVTAERLHPTSQPEDAAAAAAGATHPSRASSRSLPDESGISISTTSSSASEPSTPTSPAAGSASSARAMKRSNTIPASNAHQRNCLLPTSTSCPMPAHSRPPAFTGSPQGRGGALAAAAAASIVPVEDAATITVNAAEHHDGLSAYSFSHMLDGATAAADDAAAVQRRASRTVLDIRSSHSFSGVYERSHTPPGTAIPPWMPLTSAANSAAPAIVMAPGVAPPWPVQQQQQPQQMSNGVLPQHAAAGSQGAGALSPAAADQQQKGPEVHGCSTDAGLIRDQWDGMHS